MTALTSTSTTSTTTTSTSLPITISGNHQQNIYEASSFIATINTGDSQNGFLDSQVKELKSNQNSSSFSLNNSHNKGMQIILPAHENKMILSEVELEAGRQGFIYDKEMMIFINGEDFKTWQDFEDELCERMQFQKELDRLANEEEKAIELEAARQGFVFDKKENIFIKGDKRKTYSQFSREIDLTFQNNLIKANSKQEGDELLSDEPLSDDDICDSNEIITNKSNFSYEKQTNLNPRMFFVFDEFLKYLEKREWQICSEGGFIIDSSDGEIVNMTTVIKKFNVSNQKFTEYLASRNLWYDSKSQAIKSGKDTLSAEQTDFLLNEFLLTLSESDSF